MARCLLLSNVRRQLSDHLCQARAPASPVDASWPSLPSLTRLLIRILRPPLPPENLINLLLRLLLLPLLPPLIHRRKPLFPSGILLVLRSVLLHTRIHGFLLPAAHYRGCEGSGGAA